MGRHRLWGLLVVGEKSMGTLFDQPIRELSSIHPIRWTAHEMGFGKDGRDITPEEWQAAAAVALAARRLGNDDVRDEQLAGFGLIAKDLVYAIERIATVVEERE